MPKVRKNWLSIIALMAFVSCTSGKISDNDPKKRLQDYISESFNIKNTEGRKLLESFLTGEARSRLAAWSDEQFRKAFVDSKRQFVKLVFREVKNVSPHEVHVVYELTYMDQSHGDPAKPSDTKVTAKKLCELIQENEKWFIKEVRTIKELVEYKNEMSLP